MRRAVVPAAVHAAVCKLAAQAGPKSGGGPRSWYSSDPVVRYSLNMGNADPGCGSASGERPMIVVRVRGSRGRSRVGPTQ